MSDNEDVALQSLLEFLNVCGAGIAAAKRLIAEAKGVMEKLTWDPSKIHWVKAEGTSGPYERSEDVNNPEFKAMVKDLASHGGKLTRNGMFHWLFQNGATVGRKKRT